MQPIADKVGSGCMQALCKKMNDKIKSNPEWDDFLRSVGSITISWGLAHLPQLAPICHKNRQDFSQKLKEINPCFLKT